MQYLAKSNGVTLTEHSHAVARRCRELASAMLDGNELRRIVGPQYTTSDVINTCYYAGLLHDIGKAVPYYQEYIKGIDSDVYSDTDSLDTVVEPDKTTRYHNEFSWAVISTYEDELSGITGIHDKYCWEALKDAVFWHHAAAPDYDRIKGQDIFYVSEINPRFDTVPVVSYMGELLGVNFGIKDPIPRDIPGIFNVGPAKYADNTLIMFVRAVLIRADREVSGCTPHNVESIRPIQHLECPATFDRARFSEQMDIVDKADSFTNVIAAPAGFGKTAIGLAWAIRFSETVYWVCPRNAVIDSVFRSLSELKRVFDIDICIEKVYTGTVQGSDMATGKNCPHIVVTNIDAITCPVANNRHANKQYDMLVKPMVFDEFHEFSLHESPMFAAYNLLMGVRNDFTCARSLLMSATPYTLYNGLYLRNEVNYLPGENEHYAPQHDIPYKVYLAKSNSMPAHNVAHVFNVVQSAQNLASMDADAICCHSKFTADDKKHIIDGIYNMYGKNSSLNKMPVVSGPIMRASMDISFKHMELMVSSPNNDLQIIGRCNRWGEYDVATLTLIIPDEPSRADSVYLDHNDVPGTHIIYNKWKEYIEKNFHESMTLSELYSMYDRFTHENAGIIKEYQQLLHNRGMTRLVKECYPRRPVVTRKGKASRIKSTLRNPGQSVNFIVLDNNGHYVGPFQIDETAISSSSHLVPNEAFRQYYESDCTELMHIIQSDSEFSRNFPVLYRYLMSSSGKAGKRKIQSYRKNPSMSHNPDYPFIVRPCHMTYDSRLGYRYIT